MGDQLPRAENGGQNSRFESGCLEARKKSPRAQEIPGRGEELEEGMWVMDVSSGFVEVISGLKLRVGCFRLAWFWESEVVLLPSARLHL